MTPERMVRMERELGAINRDFKAVEATFGDDVLHLVLAKRYLSRPLGNANVAACLQKCHPEILGYPSCAFLATDTGLLVTREMSNEAFRFTPKEFGI